MPRRIEHRCELKHAAERVYAAFTDADCLRERLAEVGGRDGKLVSLTIDGDAATAVMRHSIDAEDLPGIVRRITPNGIAIDRVEAWTGGSAEFSGPLNGPAGSDETFQENGRYAGTVQARVAGFAGTLHGTMTLATTADGCQWVLDGVVRVDIPLVGGRIETVIIEQVSRLLDAEAAFTGRWLTSREP